MTVDLPSGDLLGTSGPRIVSVATGEEVRLRGVLVAGCLNMENYISGFPGHEEGIRRAAERIIGREPAGYFFDAFVRHFYGNDDASYLSSLGMNLARIAVNYRHLEDDRDPFVIKEDGFTALDRVIDINASKGIYTIIDLHALPGYQSGDWHTDNPSHKAFFWRHPHFQDRAVNLWKAIAARYRTNPWVAGYNPINEPDEPDDPDTIVAVSRRIVDAIRAEDPDHIIFLEGTDYSRSFEAFREPWPGLVYSVHDYSPAGFANSGPYPGPFNGTVIDKAALERTFLERSNFMRKWAQPIWVAEVGAVFNGQYDEERYSLLNDQLGIYEEYGASWSLCTYKDMGVMALRTVPSSSAYSRHFAQVLDKKDRLGADPWTARRGSLGEVMSAVASVLAVEFPEWNEQPYSRWVTDRLLRGILVSEPMMDEWAVRLAGLGRAELETLAASFSFAKTEPRPVLEAVLRAHSKR